MHELIHKLRHLDNLDDNVATIIDEEMDHIININLCIQNDQQNPTSPDLLDEEQVFLTDFESMGDSGSNVDAEIVTDEQN